ncbi:MAG: DNA translocase FtsK [Victivallales bacterium]|nr:DNA translocase FtsK [Victivallales bacterium]
MEEFKYYRLQCRLADAEPKNFHSLENAYELLVEFFDEKVKCWFADVPQGPSSEPPALAWIRKKLKESGKVVLDIHGRADERFCLCLSEEVVHFVDSAGNRAGQSKSAAPAIGKPCSYIPSWTELFSSAVWREQANQAVPHLPLMLGRSDDAGKEVVVNLTQLPHLLIAGATGSGKSLLVKQLINSLVEVNPPEQLRLVLFDPKCIEFALFRQLPHLLAPVINEPEKMGRALKWLFEEMNCRYRLLAATPAKNLQEYNALEKVTKLPYIVVVLDEFADLACYCAQEFERALMPLAAKSRAAGIHLIISTQRPDPKVITGGILANFPCRVAMQVTDERCSKLLLDCAGAETLQGKGDMLFRGSDGSLQRIQAGYEPYDEFTERMSRLEGPQKFDESLLDALKSTGGENV